MDKNNQQCYIILPQSGKLHRSDGSAIITEGYKDFVKSAEGEYITNGFIAAEQEGTGKAITLSAATGQPIAFFDGYWIRWDIYRDNTALMDLDPNHYEEDSIRLLVGLDGETLISLPEGMHFSRRGQWFPVNSQHTIYTGDFERRYIYSVEANEIYALESRFDSAQETTTVYRSLKTGKVLENLDEETGFIDERSKKYPQYIKVRGGTASEMLYSDNIYRIIMPDGTLLGGQYWYGLEDSWGTDVAVDYPFKKLSVCRVRDENGRWGVLSEDGHLILPTEFDQIFDESTWWSLTQSWLGAGIRIVENRGYICLKDGEWYICNSNGEMVY